MPESHLRLPAPLAQRRDLMYGYDGLHRLTHTMTLGGSAPSGSGLVGTYFSDTSLTTAVLTRTDAVVDFDWGDDGPRRQPAQRRLQRALDRLRHAEDHM